MKKFFIFLMCLSLVVLVSCGGSENSGGEKGGESGCTTSKSIGTNSLTKDLSESEISSSCIKEIADAYYPACSWQADEQKAAERIAEIKKLRTYFAKISGTQCTYLDTNESGNCPDFVPLDLHLKEIKGCEVYSIDPQSECIAPCADLYFSTDSLSFPTVYIGADSDDKNFMKGDNGTASFTSSFNPGSGNEAVFTWTEKAEDGSEIERKARVDVIVNNPDEIPDLDCFWTGIDTRCY